MALAMAMTREDWRLRRFRSEVLPSVRMARARERERRERLAAIRTLDLEPVLHAELLADMAAVLMRGQRGE